MRNQIEPTPESPGVETFRQNHPNYQGGRKNMETIGNLIMNSPEAMAGLTPAEQIESAYQHALQNNMLDEGGEEAQTIRKIRETTDPYELRRILQPNINRF